MQVLASDTIRISTSEDIVRVRQAVRLQAVQIKFNLVDQTKIVTAASELARNTMEYGGGGSFLMEVVDSNSKKGLRLTFEDQGPGIPDIDQALKDGYTSGSGMGLGLGGAKRLSHEFEIFSEPNNGTRVTILRWKGL